MDLFYCVLYVFEISEGIVDYYVEDYVDVLCQVKEELEKFGCDSDVLQLFVVDVWVYDIVVLGVGCMGEMVVEEVESDKFFFMSSVVVSVMSVVDLVSFSFMIC